MRIKTAVLLCICSFIVIVHACRKAEPFTDDEMDARLSGGDCTVFDEGSSAFTHSVGDLSFRDQQVHDLGD
jgi:hypothetical protein